MMPELFFIYLTNIKRGKRKKEQVYRREKRPISLWIVWETMVEYVSVHIANSLKDRKHLKTHDAEEQSVLRMSVGDQALTGYQERLL